jgi:Fe-S cluster assembly protein SufD
VAGIETWSEGAPAAGPTWLSERRASALAAFDRAGLPTVRDERWKYTRARELMRVGFVHQPGPSPVEAALVGVRLPAALAELVLVDGHLDRAASRAPAEALAAVGVHVTSLAEVLAGGGAAEDRALVEAHAGVVAEGADGFRALHAAFVQDGVVVRVDAGAAPAGLIHVVSVTTAGERPTVGHTLHVVAVGVGARVAWLETHVALGADCLADSLTAMRVADGATLAWHAVDVGPGARIVRAEAVVGRDATWEGHAVWTGAGLTRSEVRVRLEAPGAHCQLDGLYVLDGGAHVDNHTVVDHAAPRCTTRETYRGVLAGRSRGVFDGTVVVREGADGTDAVQSCRNLLMSEDAEASAKPRLEIYADDVKCAHGTTVGRLDPVQLAYLRMRGIGLETARRMLTEAFVEDLVRAVPHEDARDALSERVTAALAGLFGEGA